MSITPPQMFVTPPHHRRFLPAAAEEEEKKEPGRRHEKRRDAILPHIPARRFDPSQSPSPPPPLPPRNVQVLAIDDLPPFLLLPPTAFDTPTRGERSLGGPHEPKGRPPGGRNKTLTRLNANDLPPTSNENVVLSRSKRHWKIVKKYALNHRQPALKRKKRHSQEIFGSRNKTKITKDLALLSHWIKNLPETAPFGNRPIEYKRPLLHVQFIENTSRKNEPKWTLFLNFSDSLLGIRGVQYTLWEITELLEAHKGFIVIGDIQLRHDNVPYPELKRRQHLLHNANDHAIDPRILFSRLSFDVRCKMNIGDKLSKSLLELRDDPRTDANTKQRINDGVPMFHYEIAKTRFAERYPQKLSHFREYAPWAIFLDFTESPLAIQEIQYLLSKINDYTYKSKYLFRLAHIRLPLELPCLPSPKAHIPQDNQDKEIEKLIPIKLKNLPPLNKQVNKLVFTMHPRAQDNPGWNDIYKEASPLLFDENKDGSETNDSTLDLWFGSQVFHGMETFGVLTPPHSPMVSRSPSPLLQGVTGSDISHSFSLSPQASPRLEPQSSPLSSVGGELSPQLSPRYRLPHANLRNTKPLSPRIHHVRMGPPSEVPEPSFSDHDDVFSDGIKSDDDGVLSDSGVRSDDDVRSDVSVRQERAPNKLLQALFTGLLDQMKEHPKISKETKAAINNGNILLHFNLSKNKSENREVEELSNDGSATRGADWHLELWSTYSPLTTTELQYVLWNVINMEGYGKLFEIKSFVFNNNPHMRLERLIGTSLCHSIEPNASIQQIQEHLFRSVTAIKFFAWFVFPEMLPYFNQFSNLEQLTFDQPLKNDNGVLVTEKDIKDLCPNIKKVSIRRPISRGVRYKA